MKKTIAILSVAALTALSATNVSAAITQAEVLGESTHPRYTVKIRATNGQIYICLPALTTLPDGRTARECKRDDGIPVGTGISGSAAAGVGGLAFLAIVLNNSSSATTTPGG